MRETKLNALMLMPDAKDAVAVSVENELAAFYYAIGCNYIEVAQTIIPNVVMIIDEEGKLSHSRFNGLATDLYKYNYADRIVGNAIVVGTEATEFRSLTEDEINKVYELLHEEGARL